MTEATLEMAAKAMRQSYAKHTGDTALVPWERAESRKAWMVCARAALLAIREPDTAVMMRALKTMDPIRSVYWRDAFPAIIDAILDEPET